MTECALHGIVLRQSKERKRDNQKDFSASNSVQNTITYIMCDPIYLGYVA